MLTSIFRSLSSQDSRGIRELSLDILTGICDCLSFVGGVPEMSVYPSYAWSVILMFWHGII